MDKAYLQNQEGKYYRVLDESEPDNNDVVYNKDGLRIALSDIEAPLTEVPEEMPSIAGIDRENSAYKNHKKLGFIFRKDAQRIVRYILIMKGPESVCILTIKGSKNISMELDLYTFHDEDNFTRVICYDPIPSDVQ